MSKKFSNTASVGRSRSLVGSSNIRKLSYKEQREFEQLEKDIPALEQEKAELAERMSSNIPYEELEQVNKRMIEITNALEEKEMRWLELSEWV